MIKTFSDKTNYKKIFAKKINKTNSQNLIWDRG
jgi:hypothetical protein